MGAVLIKACLNGGTTRAEHPRVPLAPEELAADTREVVEAGARAVHMHPRDRAGTETLEAAAVAAALAAVRGACPGVPVGVSTGIWMTGGDAERRLAAIRRWECEGRPDFASVNLSEPGAEPLARELLAADIGVEAGVWTEEDAERLVASDLAGDLIRVLVEPQDGDAETAVARASAVDRVLDASESSVPRLHHGYGAATWAVLRAAVARGRDIRIGLEDTTVLADGRVASGNRELVDTAVALVAQVGAQRSG